MEYNHFEYGRQLAEKLRPIAESKDTERFYECTESDNLLALTNRLSSVEDTILIAIDGNNADFDYRNGDSLIEIPQYFFLALQTAGNENPDEIIAAQKRCKGICRQIQAKMMADMNNVLKVDAMKCLLPESFVQRSVGPIGDNLYGVMLGFNLKMGVNYQVDPSMWL